MSTAPTQATGTQNQWNCLNCEYAALYAPPLPAWRSTLGLALSCVCVVVLLPLPLFIARSRVVFALRVRQPATVVLLSAALLATLVIPYRGVSDADSATSVVFRVLMSALFRVTAPGIHRSTRHRA